MKYSPQTVRRFEEIQARAAANVKELAAVMAQRAEQRRHYPGIEDKALTARTEQLTRRAYECQRDWFRLRADMLDHRLRDELRAGLPTSFDGIEVPDFFPEGFK